MWCWVLYACFGYHCFVHDCNKTQLFCALLQAKNQFPGKVKVHVTLDERSGLQALIECINQQKNIIEAFTIRDVKREE